jgi:tetratricopeptide (TPR) repeat protein
MWCQWAFAKNPGVRQVGQMRGSDLSLRVALLVHGWHTTGLTILEAAEKTAEYPLVRSRLGKTGRGRRSTWGEGVTEMDETVRTIYYKFRQRRPKVDDLLEAWLWSYVYWCEWVISCDDRALDLVEQKYLERGEAENAPLFRSLAEAIRESALQEIRSPLEITEWFEHLERVYKARVRSAEEYLERIDERGCGLEGQGMSSPDQKPLVWGKIRPNQSDVAMAVVNLARLYHAYQKFPEAETCYRRAYSLYEAAVIPEILREAALPWIHSQIVNCQEGKLPDRNPVIVIPAQTSDSRPHLSRQRKPRQRTAQ